MFIALEDIRNSLEQEGKKFTVKNVVNALEDLLRCSINEAVIDIYMDAYKDGARDLIIDLNSLKDEGNY